MRVQTVHIVVTIMILKDFVITGYSSIILGIVCTPRKFIKKRKKYTICFLIKFLNVLCVHRVVYALNEFTKRRDD